MPKVVYILAAGIFAMVTSEFTVSGLMPQLATGLHVDVSHIGYLVTAFALAMSIGGPLLTMLLLEWPPRRALLVLFAVFLAGNLLAAVAPTYSVLLLARLVTGAASGAFFGVAITAAGQAVSPTLRVRATATALQGLMLGTTLGLPLATWIGGLWGWRAAFAGIGVLTVVAAVATARFVPLVETEPKEIQNLRSELGVFRSRRLWAVMSTSTLVISAAFAGFSYFTPILTEKTGIGLGAIPALLVVYGAVTVVGNALVGRLADRFTTATLVVGTTLSAAFLAVFAVAAQNPWAAIPAMLGIGLVGVTMNPALVTRVQRSGNAGALVNTVHSSMITFGVVIGSALGGVGIHVAGLRAPLWIGVVLALGAIATMIPDLVRERSRGGFGCGRTLASATPDKRR
ncbi:DHA1 family inner membrane transport protein [Rhodococcus sp. 27YEA15]|uniref:MFS transporter n=1 Tax=Rhodococcus sp. 27YEA15 TaxID=3156259 RepID=UPI003C7D39B4